MNNILFRRIDLKLSLLFSLTSVVVVLALQLGAAAISLWQSPESEQVVSNLVTELNGRKADIRSVFLQKKLGSDEDISSFLSLSERIYASEMGLNKGFEGNFSYDPYVSTLQALAFYDNKGMLIEEFLCPHCVVANLEKDSGLDQELNFEIGDSLRIEIEKLSTVIAVPK